MKIIKTDDNSIIAEQYNITRVKYVNTVISKIILGTKQIWPLIKSCFGSGTWIQTNNWSDTENWKN